MKKSTGYLLALAGCVGLAAGSYSLGAVQAQSKQENRTAVSEVNESEHVLSGPEEAQKEVQTDRIAVVDLDLGTDVNGEHTEYASSLLTDNTGTYEITSMETARTGLASGEYAAYIVIPSNFSECVVSLLDHSPEKAALQYALNENLDESVQKQVILDVLSFHEKLSDSVSFMYTDSILKEFHDAQDTAEGIMKKDQRDLEALESVQPEDLTAMLTIEPAENAQLTRDPLDIGSYTNEQANTVQTIRRMIDAGEERIGNRSEELRGQAAGLGTDLNGITEAFSDIHFSEQVRKELLETLTQEGAEYDSDLNQYETDLLALLEEVRWNVQPGLEAMDHIRAFNEQLPDVKKNLASLLVQEIRKNTEEPPLPAMTITADGAGYLHVLLDGAPEESVIEIPYTETGEPADPEGEGTGTVSRLDEEALAAQLQNAWNEQLASADLTAETSLTEEQAEALIDSQIKEVPEEYGCEAVEEGDPETVTLDALKEHIMQSDEDVETFITPGEDEEDPPLLIRRMDWEKLGETLEDTYQEDAQSAGEHMAHSVASAEQSVHNFVADMGSYHPENEINQGEIMNQQSEIMRSASLLSTLVAQRDRQSDENLLAINQANQKNVEQLRNTLTTLNQYSNEKVKSGLASVKNQKQETVQQNRESLTELTQQLPYTRLGSLEYTEAYRFIVSPTALKEQSMEAVPEKNLSSSKVPEPSVKTENPAGEKSAFPLTGLLYLILAAAVAGTVVILVKNRNAHRSNGEK